MTSICHRRTVFTAKSIDSKAPPSECLRQVQPYVLVYFYLSFESCSRLNVRQYRDTLHYIIRMRPRAVKCNHSFEFFLWCYDTVGYIRQVKNTFLHRYDNVTAQCAISLTQAQKAVAHKRPMHVCSLLSFTMSLTWCSSNVLFLVHLAILLVN